MRNLKKILALVLALVMSFSVMTVSSAAFKDEADISADYAQSVEVLSAIGVFRGDDFGNFNPGKSITRAEVAAIIYRIATGDVEDVQADFYADLNMFTDVTSDDWFAGYVNYCASAEYIKGRGDGTFNPNGKITGYDALTMILRAIGRDKNGEFTGEGYTVKVAQIAKQCGITDTLKNVALGSPATREVIAEILLNTIMVPQFSYTLTFGYSIYANPLQQDSVNGGETNPSLGWENFGLWYSGELDRTDWGVPFMYGWMQYNTPITIVEIPAVVEYDKAVTECDIAKDLGIAKEAKFSRVTENATVVPAGQTCGEFDGTINALDTRKLVGAQGRWTAIYITGYDAQNNYAPIYEMVMMDQFLAQVTDVTELTYDRNGHVKAEATVTLNVYDETWADANKLNDTTVIWTSRTANFDYVEGQLMLLNYEASLAGIVSKSDKAVYEIIGAPETLIGAQNKFSTRESHFVDGEEYFDAYRFYLDEAKRERDNHTWIFDTYGNLIAAMDIPVEDTTAYGILLSIKWVDEYNVMSNGYALATVMYMDGTTDTIKVHYINENLLEGVEGKNAVYADGLVSSTRQYNDAQYLYHTLYTITTDLKGLVHLDDTILLKDAYATQGVAALGDSGYYAGNTTQFLVLHEDDGFLTYTGIKNVDSFKKGTGYYWAVDKNNDKMAEYVYILMPEYVTSAAKYTTGTFFCYDAADLDYEYDLKTGLYTVYGGMVNGVETELYTIYGDVVADLFKYAGVLMTVTLTQGIAVAAERVDTEYVFVDYPEYHSAVYELAAKDAYIIDGVLFVDNGDAYDIEGTEIISEYRQNLEDILKFAKLDKDEETYLYIIYTFKNYTKYATTIYVSDVPGFTHEDILSEEIDVAIANVEAAQTALEKAVKALEDATSAADEVKVEDLVAAVEAAKKALADAVKALEKAVENAEKYAEENKTVVYIPTEDVEAVKAEAATAVEKADESVVSNIFPEIKTTAVEVTYTVAEDVKVVDVVIAEVTAKVLAEDGIKALIALDKDTKVEVATEFVFDGAAETNVVTFQIKVTCGTFVETYEVEISVKATAKAPAEDAE